MASTQISMGDRFVFPKFYPDILRLALNLPFSFVPFVVEFYHLKCKGKNVSVPRSASSEKLAFVRLWCCSLKCLFHRSHLHFCRDQSRCLRRRSRRFHPTIRQETFKRILVSRSIVQTIDHIHQVFPFYKVSVASRNTKSIPSQ
jgi:hypothetical protein